MDKIYQNQVLTVEQVAEIKALYEKNTYGKGIKALSRKYNVSPSTIGCIVRCKTWIDVKPAKFY
ncbi:TPA: hypothetical protein SCS57_002028 [Enterobacter cloacae]|nr:hypothetical protein [Enterobacter cloacae]